MSKVPLMLLKRTTVKIVVLDEKPLNTGDLSWEPISRQAEFKAHDWSRPEEVAPRAADADILMTNKVPLSADLIAKLPRLKCIIVLATGVNIVDLAAARARGIPVCNVPEYSTQSVAQVVFALLLELCHRIGHHDQLIHQKEWAKRAWSFWDTPQVELAGKTLGIIGYGRIGKRVAAIGRAMGMPFMASARTRRAESEVIWGSVEEVFTQSDVVSLHVPLTPETKMMVNATLLQKMKQGSYLINTARGALIDDAAVAAALHAGQLAGAGLDVTTVEPINNDNPLLTAPNCVITPHFAWATLAARRRLMKTVEQNVAAFIAGSPINVVN